jgi:hypothetical protein
MRIHSQHVRCVLYEEQSPRRNLHGVHMLIEPDPLLITRDYAICPTHVVNRAKPVSV